MTACSSVDFENVTEVEIIPLEPDQRSDLRREAPSVTLIIFSPSHQRGL